MRTHGWKEISGLRGFVWGGFVCVCCFGGFAGQRAWGQGVTPPNQSAQQVAAPAGDLFSADLELLSKRLGVAFVAEGEPFPVTKEGPAPALNENLAQEDAVREVADYFDYSAVRQGNVYLLTKRYTNPDDLPDVTPEECLFGLKAISKILTPFNPKIPPGTFAGDPQMHIIRMLSAAQLEKLSNDGLPVSELTPSQHEEVWRLALHVYLQTQADDFEESCSYLETRNPADPVFHWQTIKNIHAFGYNTRCVELNKILFIPVSNGNRIVVLHSGTTIQTTRGVETRNGVAVPYVDVDPTDPKSLSETTLQYLDEKAKSSHACTLAEAVSALNTRAAGAAMYRVDTMYAAKHVTLVGTEKLSPDVQMRALATVYGLRVVQEEKSRFVVTHPLLIEANQISDFGPALRSAIPVSIYRAIHTQLPYALSPNKGFRNETAPASAKDYPEKAGAIQSAAMKMFRYSAERAAKSRPEEKIALSHLEERVRNMFEIASTVGLFSGACIFADRPLPPYIANIDQITLEGRGYRNADGAERFSLSLSYVDPKTGLLRAGVSFSNAIVP